MKEIGGYFQLEEMPGEEYYPDLYRVNLGRTALLWLLKSRRCRKILLPYFLCGSVVHTCQENQIETEFYHLNEKLEVLYPKEQLPEGEYLYLVNYYGQLSDSRISDRNMDVRQRRLVVSESGWKLSCEYVERNFR